MTVIRNNLNFVFGGFTSVRWNSNYGYITDPTVFIFSLRRNGASNIYKLRISSSSFAIFVSSSYGPTFGGGHDFYICEESNIYTGSYSNIYSYVSPDYPPGSDRTTFLGGSYNTWLTTEIEVYQIFK